MREERSSLKAINCFRQIMINKSRQICTICTSPPAEAELPTPCKCDPSASAAVKRRAVCAGPGKAGGTLGLRKKLLFSHITQAHACTHPQRTFWHSAWRLASSASARLWCMFIPSRKKGRKSSGSQDLGIDLATCAYLHAGVVRQGRASQLKLSQFGTCCAGAARYCLASLAG